MADRLGAGDPSGVVPRRLVAPPGARPASALVPLDLDFPLRRRLLWYGGYALFAVLFALTTRITESPQVEPDVLNAWVGLRVGLAAGAVYALFGIYRIAIFRARSVAQLRAELRRDLPWIVERVAGGCWFLAFGILVFRSFLHWKPLIGSVMPYRWDPWFTQLDNLLHFGVDPWVVSQALFAPWTGLIDWVYVSWFSVKVAAFVLFATFRPIQDRARFYWAVGLMYLIGGTALAHVFASGGPVFHGRLVGDPMRFADLLPHLENTRAAVLQDRLWSSLVESQSATAFSGISAMPSIHVAFAVLLASWGWSTNRWVGAVATAYAALIFIGSVHLGWHYAVDGYLGALIGWACWKAAGRIVLGRTGPDGEHTPAREA